MSNDKTLATVKHGGCVRLGDWLPPLPIRQRFTTLHGETYAYSAEQMREYALAALSAQPSPGGQGDALLEQVARFLDYSTGHDPWPNIRRVYGDSWWEPVNKMRDELRALAARQPVRIYGCCSQPEGELHTAECSNMRHLAARQPVGEPSLYQIREVVRDDEDEWLLPTVARRQTWREIPKAHYDVYVSVMGGCGPMGVIGDPCGNVALELNQYGPMREVRALYAAPPAQQSAQAVDLGQFLPAVRMLVVSARTSGGTAGRDAHLCEALDRVEALLLKVDSQAVGNG